MIHHNVNLEIHQKNIYKPLTKIRFDTIIIIHSLIKNCIYSLKKPHLVAFLLQYQLQFIITNGGDCDKKANPHCFSGLNAVVLCHHK